MSSIPKYSPIWLLERQSFRFQKITKNLKMNIFCRNFANSSFFFEEQSPKRKLKIKFVLNLLSGKTVFNLVKGKTIFCSFSFKHDFLCFELETLQNMAQQDECPFFLSPKSLHPTYWVLFAYLN